MRKQRIFLKYRIQFPLIGRFLADFFPRKNHFSFICIQKSSQNPKKGRLSTSTWSQKGYKFIFINVQINPLQYNLVIKLFHDSAKLNNLVFLHLASPSLCRNLSSSPSFFAHLLYLKHGRRCNPQHFRLSVSMIIQVMTLIPVHIKRLLRLHLILFASLHNGNAAL